VFAGALLSLAWQRPVQASGFDNPQVGPASSGPVTVDAAAVHWNPGQLGYLDRPELEVGLGVIFGNIAYQRERLGQYQYADNLDFAEPIDPADLDPSRTGTARRIRVLPVGPNFDAFFAIPVIRDRLVLGVGFYIPYAAIIDAPEDGPQRYAVQDITLLSTHTTLSAAVKLHEVISIGAGVSYVFSFLEQSRVQDFGAVDTFGDGLEREPIAQQNDFGADAPSTVRELDVLARQIDIERGLSHSVSFNAGVALRPTEKLRLGLVYQHGSRLRFRGRFRLNMDDDFFTQDLAAQGLEYPPLVEGDAEVGMNLPKRVTLGAGYGFTRRFDLQARVSWAFYSDFDTIDIRLSSPELAQPTLGIGRSVDQPLVRNWQGTLVSELQAAYAATEKLGLTLMFGYHMPASPDSTIDMVSPDGHRLVFGAGAGYAFNDRVALLTDFEGQAIVPRRVTTSEFDLGNGEYRMFLGYFGVHGQFKFGKGGKLAHEPPRSPTEDAAQEQDRAP
jgi:long-chain fatty acid transport protein